MGRKTFISFAFSQKISTVDITKVTGHTSEKILKHYVNSLRDEVKEEFQNMDSFIMDRENVIGSKSQQRLKNKLNKEKVEGVTVTSAGGNTKSIKERLVEMRELFDDGLISEEEYELKRRIIIEEL